MRESQAAAALIARTQAGERRWLAQWNERWGCYNLVAGHQHPGEAPRDCLVREVAEELGLAEGPDCQVAREPRALLEYTAWSESAQAETRYRIELYDVRLSDDACRRIERDPANAWLADSEILSLQASDGRPVGSTAGKWLIQAGLLPDPLEGLYERYLADEPLSPEELRRLAASPRHGALVRSEIAAQLLGVGLTGELPDRAEVEEPAAMAAAAEPVEPLVCFGYVRGPSAAGRIRIPIRVSPIEDAIAVALGADLAGASARAFALGGGAPEAGGDPLREWRLELQDPDWPGAWQAVWEAIAQLASTGPAGPAVWHDLRVDRAGEIRLPWPTVTPLPADLRILLSPALWAERT